MHTMNAIATIDQTGRPLPPSIIGFNVNGQTLSTLDTLKHVASNITVKGLWKVGAATVIAAGATAVRGANVALAEVEDSRAQLQGRVEMLQKRNSALTTALVAAETKASRKIQRWTDAERAHLATFFAAPKHKPYAVIAADMADRFGRAFTAASVGAQARKLGLVTKAPAKPAKAASKARKRRAG
jgi:hypothetical protein